MGMISDYPAMHQVRWDAAEVAYLHKAVAAGTDVDVICARLARTQSAVYSVAVREGLRLISPYAKTTADELRQQRLSRIERAVELRHAGYRNHAIAERLRIARSTVREYLALRGFAPHHDQRKPTAKALATIARMYPSSAYVMSEICEAAGMSKNRVIGHAHRMGLRRPEHGTGRRA